MSPGRLVRSLLGVRASRIAGDAYRALFADMDEAADTIAREIPTGAHVLDVGGGDGAIVDRHALRVERLPATTLAAYVASGRPDPDVVLMTDVVHHVPPGDRGALLGSVATLMRRSPALRVVVKDVEPGHVRARLGYWSDRYITGDRNVQPVSRAQLVAAMQRADAGMRWSETPLFDRDRPNYALVFWREA